MSKSIQKRRVNILQWIAFLAVSALLILQMSFLVIETVWEKRTAAVIDMRKRHAEHLAASTAVSNTTDPVMVKETAPVHSVTNSPDN